MFFIIAEKQLSLAESIYLSIKEKIIYDEYPAGSILSEGELASVLQVSKTPVREALNGLKHEGLIEVIPYKGYIVLQLSVQELRDLFELRAILESAAIQLAIQRIHKVQLEHFRKLAMIKFDVKDLEQARKEFMKINIEFHCYLGEVSGNKQLADLIEKTVQKLQRGLFMALKESSLSEMEAEHLDLVNAIEAKDGTKAKKIIIKHLQDSQRNSLGIY